MMDFKKVYEETKQRYEMNKTIDGEDHPNTQYYEELLKILEKYSFTLDVIIDGVSECACKLNSFIDMFYKS